uniref:Link domain-containing protein n=1 Tax=Amphilophus citrinellus TaxID=61819 RepID=A0A3Q0QWH9_AMPCI
RPVGWWGWGVIFTVRTCSVAGVFRAEGTGRHSLNYDMAIKVCEQQMSTIATEEQLHEAYNKSLQTCRCIKKHLSQIFVIVLIAVIIIQSS